MIKFTNMRAAGLLPLLLANNTGLTVPAQLNITYAHGGGWHKFEGFELRDSDLEGDATLCYPDDPPMREVSRAMVDTTLVILFEASWLAVVQSPTEWEVARID